MDHSTPGSCPLGCAITAGICKEPGHTYFACAAASSFECDADGKPVAVGCNDQARDYGLCIIGGFVEAGTR
jgi:hypothetical protein